MRFAGKLAFLLAAVSAGAAFADIGEVETRSGVLRGFASAHQPGVTVFQGVAFAAPPLPVSGRFPPNSLLPPQAGLPLP